MWINDGKSGLTGQHILTHEEREIERERERDS